MAALSQTPDITINGSPLTEVMLDNLVEVVVDVHLALPDAFTLRFSDSKLDVAENLRAHVGDAIVIKSGGLGDRPEKLLTKGEITGFDASLDVDGRYFVVRGYDKSHRLQGARKVASWEDVTDSDIVRRIVSAAGLDVGVITPTSTVHKHVVQMNVTDWDFIRARARANGFEAGVVDGKFNFGSASMSMPHEIEFGEELVEFRPRVSGAQLTTGVEVSSWDEQAKKRTEGKKMSAASEFVSLGESALAPKKLAGLLGAGEEKSARRVMRSQAEADTAAQSLVDELSSSHAEAEGVVVGDAALKAGTKVKIKGVGTSFAGEWRLTRAVHRFSPSGYFTQFEVAGTQDRSLLGLASGGGAPESTLAGGGSPVYGVMIGLVSDNSDPLTQGRVKVKLPWLADDYASGWARVCFPGAGNERGFYNLPEVGDEVLVMFEQGDVNYPYVIGSLYNGKDKVPDDAVVDGGDGSVVTRTWTSAKKHKMFLSDKSGEEGITITLDGDTHFFALKKQDDEVRVSSNGKTVVIGKKGIEITSDNGDVVIKGMNVKIEAQTGLELKGTTAKLEGSAQTEIKGGMIKLN